MRLERCRMAQSATRGRPGCPTFLSVSRIVKPSRCTRAGDRAALLLRVLAAILHVEVEGPVMADVAAA